MDNNDDRVRCPKCGSLSIEGHKKGFSAGKGCLGFLLMFPLMLFAIVGVIFAAIVGLLFGASGKNKMKRYCLNCGYKW